ncbi:MAG: cytochrome P450 [Actinomycetota bacterium]
MARTALGRPLEQLERAARSGDVVAFRLPGGNAVLANHPDLVWEALVSRHRDVRKGPTVDLLRLVLGDGLLTSEGDLHRRQRRMIQPAFRRDRVAGYGQDIVTLAGRRADAWSSGEPVDVHAEMTDLSLAVVARSLFGVDVPASTAGDVAASIATLLRAMRILSFPGGDVFGRLPIDANHRRRRAQERLDHAVDVIVAQKRRAGAEGDDLLSVLLRTEDDDDHAHMSDEQVRDEVMTLFLAGHETTANALTFTWHLLGSHPTVEEALHAELAQVLGDTDPTPADVGRLPLTDAIVRESLRLYPPSWAMARRTRVDMELAGNTVAAKDTIVVSQWLLHRDPRWWDAPALFRPLRWTEQPASERPRGAYFPFGAGPRICVGEPLARAELVLALATIARRVRLRPIDQGPLPLQALVTLRPRGPVPMRPEPRTRAHP